jgi:hypothetical protein
MKKIKLIIFLASIALLFVSCSRNITEPTINSSPTKPAQTTVAFNSTVFDKFHMDSLVTFSWKPVDFGFQASVAYAVQASNKQDFSANLVTILNSTNLSGTASFKNINGDLLGWNGQVGTAFTVYFRVMASVSSNVAPVYSDVFSKSFTTFDMSYPIAYLAGDFQGWAPAAGPYLYSYAFNTTFSSIVRLNSGSATTQVKICQNPNWDVNWGSDLTANGTSYTGHLVTNGNNMVVNSGCYIMTADLTALTVSFTKTDDWGIIGDATPGGWGASTPMTYDGKNKIWTVTLDLTAATVKFRANDAWDLNYGSNANDGTLQPGGSNIPIASAGNYTVTFDPSKLTYTVKKN